LEFSGKYHENEFPGRYASKHRASFSRRINDTREQSLLRRALGRVGPLDSIVDVGCGPGRFWSTINSFQPARFAALDVSHSMLSFARSAQAPEVVERIELAAGSVTALPFIDNAFDCVISMRLLHHFGDVGERRQALAELARVTGHHLIVSLWVDGNYKAWRRQRLESRRGPRGYQNRHVVTKSQLAADFQDVGLRELDHFDLIPGYSQWRYCVLEVPGR
jgi:SAM-dependent methyltransferase